MFSLKKLLALLLFLPFLFSCAAAVDSEDKNQIFYSLVLQQ